MFLSQHASKVLIKKDLFYRDRSVFGACNNFYRDMPAASTLSQAISVLTLNTFLRHIVHCTKCVVAIILCGVRLCMRSYVTIVNCVKTAKLMELIFVAHRTCTICLIGINMAVGALLGHYREMCKNG
jgi:hypothetical protein